MLYPRRVWVNCPSTLQPHHDIHGKVGIAVNDDGNGYSRVYFTEGPIHSMRIKTLYLAEKM